MKCGSCGIEISKEFKVAIQKNMCPACGKSILASGNLAAFVPLCELISTLYTVSPNQVQEGKEEQDYVESLATLIISTFDVRIKGVKNDVPAPTQETQEPESDEQYKQKQMANAKDRLKQIRDEAYENALKDQWGMGNESVPELVVKQKKEQAYNNMINGTGKIKRSE